MLNEIIEYEQYTISPELFDINNIHPRLKYHTFFPSSEKDRGRSGMSRAMTVVARGYIFGKDGKKDYKSLFNRDGVFNDKKVVEVLKAWCGLECKEEVDIFEKNWIKLYVRYYFNKELAEEKNNDKELVESDNKLPIDVVVKQYLLLENVLELMNSILSLDSGESKQQKELNDKLEKLKKSIDFLADDKLEKYTEVEKEYNSLRKIINRYKSKAIYPDKYKRLSKIIDFLIDYEKTFNPPTNIFTTPYNPSQNDLKTIKYKNIIANALNNGPLRRYYLACNKNPMDFVRTLKQNGSYKPIGKTAKKPDLFNNARDRIFKTTAYYLLQKRNSDFQKSNSEEEHDLEFVFVNMQDLINWMKIEAEHLKTDLKKVYFVTPNGEKDVEPIFDFITVAIARNTMKLKVNPRWIKAFGFKLVEEHDIGNPENQGLILYSDWGSGKYLEEKRYDED